MKWGQNRPQNIPHERGHQTDTQTDTQTHGHRDPVSRFDENIYIACHIQRQCLFNSNQNMLGTDL